MDCGDADYHALGQKKKVVLTAINLFQRCVIGKTGEELKEIRFFTPCDRFTGKSSIGEKKLAEFLGLKRIEVIQHDLLHGIQIHREPTQVAPGMIACCKVTVTPKYNTDDFTALKSNFGLIVCDQAPVWGCYIRVNRSEFQYLIINQFVQISKLFPPKPGILYIDGAVRIWRFRVSQDNVVLFFADDIAVAWLCRRKSLFLYEANRFIYYGLLWRSSFLARWYRPSS